MPGDECSKELVENSERQLLGHAPRVKGKLSFLQIKVPSSHPLSWSRAERAPAKTTPSSLNWKLNTASPKPYQKVNITPKRLEHGFLLFLCLFCFLFGLFFLHHSVCFRKLMGKMGWPVNCIWVSAPNLLSYEDFHLIKENTAWIT